MEKVWERVTVQDVPPGRFFKEPDVGVFIRVKDGPRNADVVNVLRGASQYNDEYCTVVGLVDGRLSYIRRDQLVWVETDAQPEFVVRIGDCWYWGKTGVPTDKAENAAKYPTNGDAQKAIEQLPKYVDRSIACVEEFS